MTSVDTNSQIQALRSTSRWSDAFDIAVAFDNSPDSSVTDELIIEAYETAIDLGLSIVSNKEKYIEANKVLARQYMRYEKYPFAQKHLLMLDTHLQDKPSWFHIYFANTLLRTTLPNLVQDPSPLFDELDSIAVSDASAIEQRRITFFSFLHEISSGVENGRFSQSEIPHQIIFKKAAEYSVIKSLEVGAFHKAVCPSFDISAFIPISTPKTSTDSKESEQPKSQVKISDTPEYKELQSKFDSALREVERLRKQIGTLQADLSNQSEQIEQKDKELRDIQRILLEKNTDSKKASDYVKKLEQEKDALSKKLSAAIALAESKSTELQSAISKLADASAEIEKLASENRSLRETTKAADSNRPVEFEVLGYIFGSLNLVVIPLRKWLTENFKKLSPNGGWYKRYVVDPIVSNRDDRNWMVRKVKNSFDLEFLDAYTLLYIAKINIDKFYSYENSDKKTKKNCIYTLSDIRNELSHLDGKEFDKSEIIDILGVISDFVSEFSSEKYHISIMAKISGVVKKMDFSTINFQSIPLFET